MLGNSLVAERLVISAPRSWLVQSHILPCPDTTKLYRHFTEKWISLGEKFIDNYREISLFLPSCGFKEPVQRRTSDYCYKGADGPFPIHWSSYCRASTGVAYNCLGAVSPYWDITG
jgi:hypothetical protein